MHHVFARGNWRQLVFLDDRDRRLYLRLLAHVTDRQGWRCLAYCLMSNHVHLVLETPRPNLGDGMRRLHGDYARAFNDRHGRAGHLFQGRYGSNRIDGDAHLWTTIRYVARNPVKAGLCDDPRTYAWSSYGATVRGTAPAWLDVDRLVELFGGGPTTDRFADFVSAT